MGQISFEASAGDGISCIRFSDDAALLATASWDSQLRLHDTARLLRGSNGNEDAEACLRVQKSHKAPILACAFDNRTRIYSGGLDHRVFALDPGSEQEVAIGYHDHAVSTLVFNNATRKLQILSFHMPDDVLNCSPKVDTSPILLLLFCSRYSNNLLQQLFVLLLLLQWIILLVQDPSLLVTHLLVSNYCLDLLVSGSWDKSIKLWDTRTCDGNAIPAEHSIDLAHKVFSLATTEHRLVCAMSDLLINVYDLRNLNEALQERQSSLKYMTRTVACMPSGEGFAIGTVEGRVGVEFFEDESRKFAFKCHRKSKPTADIVYPVNAIAYRPSLSTFFTGGGDGTIALWDQDAKKRLKLYPSFYQPVQALDTSSDGQWLAIGTCPEYVGDKENFPASNTESRGSLYIRACDD